MRAFPEAHMDVIRAYQEEIGVDARLRSTSREEMLGIAPAHDSTDPPQYWPDKVHRWLRVVFGRNPYVRKIY